MLRLEYRALNTDDVTDGAPVAAQRVIEVAKVSDVGLEPASGPRPVILRRCNRRGVSRAYGESVMSRLDAGHHRAKHAVPGSRIRHESRIADDEIRRPGNRGGDTPRDICTAALIAGRQRRNCQGRLQPLMSPKAKRRPVHDVGRHLGHPFPARLTCFEKLFFEKLSFAVSVERGQSRRCREVLQPHRSGQPATVPASIDDERTAERLAVDFHTFDCPVTDNWRHAGAMDMNGNAELLRAIQQDRVELGTGNMKGPPGARSVGAEGCGRSSSGYCSCTSRRSYRASIEHLIEDT